MTDGAHHIGKNIGTSYSRSATPSNPKASSTFIALQKAAVRVFRAVELPFEILGALAVIVGVIGLAAIGIEGGSRAALEGFGITLGAGASLGLSTLPIHNFANQILSNMDKIPKDNIQFIKEHRSPSQTDLKDFYTSN